MNKKIVNLNLLILPIINLIIIILLFMYLHILITEIIFKYLM
jgi:hypothetical protein